MRKLCVLPMIFAGQLFLASYGMAASTKIESDMKCRELVVHETCSLDPSDAEIVGVSDSPDEFPKNTKLNVTELAEYFKPGALRVGRFIWARVPNLQEMGLDGLVCIPLEILLERGAGLNLGSTNAKSLVRDLAKLITSVVKSVTNTEVAGSGKAYDASNILSQLSKPGIKFPIYFLLTRNGFSSGVAGALANFPGDVTARTWIKLGEDYQTYLSSHKSTNSTNAPLSFGAYVGDNIYGVPVIAAQASIEVLPKVGVASFFGGVLAAIGVNRACDWLVYSSANILALGIAAPRVLHASMLGPKGKDISVPFGTNVAALTAAGLGLAGARAITVWAIAGATALKFAVNTYILATASKATMDGVGKLSKLVHASYLASRGTDVSVEVKQEPKEDKTDTDEL